MIKVPIFYCSLLRTPTGTRSIAIAAGEPDTTQYIYYGAYYPPTEMTDTEAEAVCVWFSRSLDDNTLVMLMKEADSEGRITVYAKVYIVKV